MPTYQYACRSCGHEFDAVQAFSDDSLTECPECGGELRKVYGAVGVVFKGSGFYRNDSRSTNNGAPAAKGEGDAGKSSSTGDAATKSSGDASGSSSSSSDSATAAKPAAASSSDTKSSTSSTTSSSSSSAA